ncbi:MULTISPECIES: PTS fructose transporter subunit IIABC [unclassified Exiguobacterium]|jgi:PTS system fructose-specific IIC component|uniref:PTS fructose transporter subunit IIABC n=1 Tax=Exiguobacterium TaxID=33986 RepID=UPI001040A8DF|nr:MULTISPECIES: PTS fructose transporter subunit IIABC [unclassified Exiguobacterium]TCI74100.1 PTS fructose transporter subunit IIA [Exiguobacterium sp. IPCI3]TCI83256.1 PTS fructose transporter subunit IIA [Exiguobacterium sp. IPCH1]TCI84310.1 PTS fructose transporter subunit IIA [Exiguobacterium sp. IPBC4]
MNITDLLKKDTIQLNLRSRSKAEVIEELVDVLDHAGKLSDRNGYRDAILAREAQSTTGLGEGIAIPHAKTKAVKQPAIAFGRSEGIDYEALDGQDSRLFFMIAAGEHANNEHLETLSKLSVFLMDPAFQERLYAATSEDDVIRAIEEKEAAEAAPVASKPVQADAPYILAVTACPTGIAHTYMAADSLKQKAEAMGVDIKVETNGSTGVKNELTAADIAKATAIIVAADKAVEMDRFAGKHVIEVPVAQGIRKPEELINRAVKQDAPVYRGTGSSGGTKEQRTGIYKHLMSGVSAMLPLVVAGGLLIAISFFWGINSANPDDPSFNEFAAQLNTIGGAAFSFLVPILAGFIAMSIADRPGLAPGLVAGLLASQGGAGFLGGLIAGFLAGYVVLFLVKALSKLPASLEGIKPVLLYPLLGSFISGMIMLLVVNKPIAAFMTWLMDVMNSLSGANAILLGVIVGGMMAVDMGGPINKTAYVFGTAALTAGNQEIMAAVMAGGMVPPLLVAFASTVFARQKFSKQEREAGKTAYIMGASFITEAAIPFAAADPIRVLPSAILGSAIAGGLSAFFAIQLPAPHGGVFVFPLLEGAGNVVMSMGLYALAILAGALIGALLLSFLKKPLTSSTQVQSKDVA